MDGIGRLLNKLPWTLILIFSMGYLALQYYQFTSDAASPLLQREAQIKASQTQIQNLKDKIEESKRFYASLDTKRLEIRALTSELSEMKATLADELNVAAFIKMVVTEAKKVGINVQGILPQQEEAKEFYIENTFELSFRGFYVQLLVFLQRLAHVQRVVRVDEFEISPSGPTSGRFVELTGKIRIKTFRYAFSKADEILQKSQPSSPSEGGGT